MAARKLFANLTVVAAFLGHCSFARAEGAQTGTIDGMVADAAGQPLRGVTVTLGGPQAERTTVTLDDGSYRFALLQPGRYTVRASLEGLGSAEYAVVVEGGARRGVELVLARAPGEEITVRSAAPLVSRYEIGATASLESDVAENLAFRSRLYAATVRMLPGVVNVAATGGVPDEDMAPAMNGGNISETAAFIEGVDTSITRRGGELRFTLPISAVNDTRIEGAGFGAEYGRAVSGVINTTIKTGTNVLHGEGVYVAQNTKWRAAYEALDIPRPDDAIGSWEASLGGPLYRSRAWFFAAAASLSSNQLDLVPSGEVVDVSREFEPGLLKFNAQPGTRHQITLTGIDSPSDAVFVPANGPGDIYALVRTPNEQTLYTGTWTFAASAAAFVEAKASSRREDVLRADLLDHPIAPGASPDSPLGNNFRYIDQADGLRYNASATPLGTGFNQFPRDQGNASSTLFFRSHEVKLGADYQDVAFENLTQIGQEYRGRGYDVDLPGGYAEPANKRVYAPSGVVASTGESVALFAQDRVDFGRRLIVTYGVRVDDQVVHNDVGEEVVSYTEPAPRMSAVWDAGADGRLLVRATAGRYYRTVALDIATREFARLPSGNNEYDQFAWNPATERYDGFQQHVTPRLDAQLAEFDPMYKDEVSAGVDWQLHRDWVLNARLLWHEMGDLFWSTEQFDPAGRVRTDVRNWDDGFRRYRGLVLELDRSFRGGWAVRSNYTWGKADGNVEFNTDDDDTFEGMGGVEEGTGRTDATVVNRGGRLWWDREHVLNVAGLKRWTPGRHDAGMGAYYFFRSGQRWGTIASTTIVHPISGETIDSTTYLEPNDAHQMADTFGLSLVADWSFPIANRVRGKVGVEVANATDEQEAVAVNVATGEPSGGVVAYQVPRELRVELGVSF
jgi:hypothetical protein